MLEAVFPYTFNWIQVRDGVCVVKASYFIFILSVLCLSSCKNETYVPSQIQTSEDELVEAAAEALLTKHLALSQQVSERDDSTVVAVLPEHTLANEEFLEKVSQRVIEKIAGESNKAFVTTELIRSSSWLQDVAGGQDERLKEVLLKLTENGVLTSASIKRFGGYAVDTEEERRTFAQRANRRLDFRRHKFQVAPVQVYSSEDATAMLERIKALQADRTTGRTMGRSKKNIADEVQKDVLAVVSQNLRSLPQARENLRQNLSEESMLDFRVRGVLYEKVRDAISAQLIPNLRATVFDTGLIVDERVYKFMVDDIRRGVWHLTRVYLQGL